MQRQFEPLETWLTRNGFPDREVAEAAGLQLDTPQLRPLWQKLQQKLQFDSSRSQLANAAGPLKGSSAADQSDLSLGKLRRLLTHVQDSRHRLLKAQVSLDSAYNAL